MEVEVKGYDFKSNEMESIKRIIEAFQSLLEKKTKFRIKDMELNLELKSKPVTAEYVMNFIDTVDQIEKANNERISQIDWEKEFTKIKWRINE